MTASNRLFSGVCGGGRGGEGMGGGRGVKGRKVWGFQWFGLQWAVGEHTPSTVMERGEYQAASISVPAMETPRCVSRMQQQYIRRESAERWHRSTIMAITAVEVLQCNRRDM